MKVKLLKEEKVTRLFEVLVPAKEIQTKLDKKISEVALEAEIPNFRKGKVPLDFVEKKYGDKIRQHILEEYMKSAVEQMMTEFKISIASKPDVKFFEVRPGKDFKYTYKCEVFPELAELAYDKMKLTKHIVDISEKDLDEEIKRVMEFSPNYVPYAESHKAKKGDFVLIDYDGYVEGEKYEGGEGRDYYLKLGSNNFIKGFEDALIGSKSGDEKDLRLSFPANYHVKKLEGKRALFKVKVKGVAKVEEQVLDVEYVKKFGMNSVEEFQKLIKDRMNLNIEDQSRNLLKKQLFDYMDTKIKVDIPASMVDAELASLLADYVKRMGFTDEASAKSDKDYIKTKKEYKALANRRVKSGIVLSDLAKKSKIIVSDAEVYKVINDRMRGYPQEQIDAELKNYKDNPVSLEYVRGPILEDRVVDFIFEKISFKDKSLSYSAFIKLLESNK